MQDSSSSKMRETMMRRTPAKTSAKTHPRAHLAHTESHGKEGKRCNLINAARKVISSSNHNHSRMDRQTKCPAR